MTSKRLSPRAFTLIELLVVIAIISVLINIMLPALGKAKHNALAVVCLSNQRNTGQDIADYNTNMKGQFPYLTTGGNWFHPEVMTCPEDRNPVMMPKEALGTDADVPMSYGFNPEYALFNAKAGNLRNPSNLLTHYDGFSGQIGSSSKNKKTSGTYGGDYFLDGKKIMITHLPPGNKANPQVVKISLNALDAHVGHNHADSTHVDLIGNWVINGQIDIPTYTKGDFARRHPLGPGVGHAAFADGHAISTQQLEPTWYMFPK